MSVAASEDHISYFSRDAVVVVVIRVSFPARAMISFEEGLSKKRQFGEEISPNFSHTICVRERERVSRGEKKDSLLVYLFFVLWRRVSSLLPNHHNPYPRVGGGGGINWIVD